jgi:prepilin-type N-terminal cleavage/methylation domain-containing protein
MKKAFTLIELLVVIAIIAILAAILFPVFAQAKSAAKRTVSLSNTKQITLACIMYATDYDDTVVVALDTSPVGSPDGASIQPWSWLVIPYLKSVDVFLDPQASPTVLFGPAEYAQTINAYFPEYGINSTYLSFLLIDDMGNKTLNPITYTTIGQPAETVFLGAKFGNGETVLPPDEFFWYGPPSVPTTIMINPPDCNTVTNPMVWCYDSWGLNGFYDGYYLQGNAAAGSQTGGMSLRSVGLAIVSWADGHSTASHPGYLAQGTNWTPTGQASNVVMVDQSKYLWDTN